MRNLARTTLSVGLMLAAITPARADVLTRWMATVDRAYTVASENNDPDWRTARNTRTETQVAVAMFEAVNAVEGRYAPYLGLDRAPAGTSPEAAAASAAHAVLSDLYPDQKETFDAVLTISLAEVPDGAGEDAGVALGLRAAEAVRAKAGLPADAVLVDYRPATVPGVYIDGRLPSIQPFDLAMPPWILARADELRSPPPPAMTSEHYARDLNEVKRLGSEESPDRPEAMGLLAEPFVDINYLPLLADIARGPGRSLSQNARMYALTLMAADDGWLSVMEAKMHYGTWRPITAIRNADQDDNPATERDAGWRPLLRTPTHPDYPCGHCVNAAAIATVLEAETGHSPAAGIRVVSYDSPWMEVSFPNWTAFVNAMSMSRIYAGAHTRFANDAAEVVGREVGRRALATQMRPVEPPR